MQEYIKVDQRLHQLAQLLAKAGRTFVPKKDDDSHTSLSFDPMGQRILTHPFGDNPRSLGFDLSNQSFMWVGPNRWQIDLVKLAGQTIKELEDALAKILEESKFDSDDYREDLHFYIPDYKDLPTTFDPLDEQALGEWMYYRRLANQVGNALLAYLQTSGAVRIWPHHFDTGVYTMVGGWINIGYGFAPADGIVNTPYFYLSGHPNHGAIDYSKADQLSAGQWKTDGEWKGAVLPISDLPQRHAMRVITKFVREATDSYLKVIM